MSKRFIFSRGRRQDATPEKVPPPPPQPKESAMDDLEARKRNPGKIPITLRATERTPDHLRRRDGDAIWIDPTAPFAVFPASGSRGTFFGVPGVMRGGFFAEDGLVWEMEELPPPPPDPGPAWARELDRKLDEIKTMLADADTRQRRAEP